MAIISASAVQILCSSGVNASTHVDRHLAVTSVKLVRDICDQPLRSSALQTLLMPLVAAGNISHLQGYLPSLVEYLNR